MLQTASERVQSEINRKGRPRPLGSSLRLCMLAQLCMLLASTVSAVAYTSTAQKRYTTSSNPYPYDSEETYTDVSGISEKFRMQWEMYEGSIALTQMAVVWKEVSDQSNYQITRATSGKTSTDEVIRIRRVWQLESKGASLGIYDDEQSQLKNNFANMEIVNPYPKKNPGANVDPEWFVGDIVPFERCAYIVNFNSDASKKYYSFSRLQTATRWDPVKEEKLVLTQVDHTSDEYSANLNGDDDIPIKHVEIGFWPLKGSFFYFVKGKLFLKHDPTADMTDTCDPATLAANSALNRCDNSSLKDPCARDTPLFLNSTKVGSTPVVLRHHSIQVSTSSSNTNYAVTFETVFDSLFVVFSGEQTKIYRVAGEAYDSLEVTAFYTINSGTSSLNEVLGKLDDGTTSMTKTITSGNIETMCSMDFHGLFVQVSGKTKVIRLELKIANDDADEPAITKEPAKNNQFKIDNTVYHELATPSTQNFRLFQTKGYYARNRPCYMIQENQANQMYRLTTTTTAFFADSDLAAGIDLYTTSWSEGVVKQGPQLMRFHLFATMPGLINDSISMANLDYDHIKAFIYDIRSRKEWGKFKLTNAGDGTLDASAGEECDPSMTPPTNYIYDTLKSSTDPKLAVYPNSATTPATNKIPNGKVTWVAANTVLDESGSTARTKYLAEGYYSCESQAFLIPYDGCGDGVPSNGPPVATSGHVNTRISNTDRAQRNGALTNEVCDDGGRDTGGHGHACSADCKTITDGYECLEWGKVCTPQCGNGYVEGTWGTDAQSNPVFNYEKYVATGVVKEECDLGTLYNAPLDYAAIPTASAADWDYVRRYPCSKDCKLIEAKFQTPFAATYPKTSKTSVPTKWSCTIDSSATPRGSEAKANPNLTGFKQKCTYLCGNRELKGTEECDIGDWAFHYLDSSGYKKLAYDKTGTVVTDMTISPSATDVANWFTNERDDPTKNTPGSGSDGAANKGLALGCTPDCMAVVNNQNAFKFSTTAFSLLGTDRCGDGFMDGIIEPDKIDGSGKVKLRETKQPTCIEKPPNSNLYTGTCALTGYIPYLKATQYEDRILDEQCDNGGDTSHGCDELCQIKSNWECHHYYHHLVYVETPYYTSICQETNPLYKTLSRRLSPDDFDSHGRVLSHWPRKTYSVILPSNTNTMRPGKHTIYLEPKTGLNGQLRIMETSACALCNGFTFAYERTAASNADYWYYNIRRENSSPTTQDDEIKHDMVAGTLYGKQRGTFGPYMVVNKNFNQIEIWGYTTAAGDKTFKKWWTSTTEASVEYLGAHEFFWFPYKSLLMAKVGDGSSMRLFRFASNFRAVADAITAGNLATNFKMKDYIESNEFRLFHVSGRTMIQPRFWKKMAYFYVSSQDSTVQPKLQAYQWNDVTYEFEKKCESDLTIEASQALYHKYSFVSVGDDGVIFHQWASSTFKVYKCADPGSGWAMTDATVTIDNTANAEVGAQKATGVTTIDPTKLVLVQAREDPDSYTEGSYPDIYGLHNSGYIVKFTWAASTITAVAPSITVPVDLKIVVSPEWFDIGKLNMAILQPVQCAGKVDKLTLITRPAIQVYNFGTSAWTCRDIVLVKDLMERSTTDYWDHENDPT